MIATVCKAKKCLHVTKDCYDEVQQQCETFELHKFDFTNFK